MLEHPSEDVGRAVSERVVQVLEIARNAGPRMVIGKWSENPLRVAEPG